MKTSNLLIAIVMLIGISLITIHGLFSSVFVVDVFSIVILLIISIPALSIFLKRAKLWGAEFEFREEIENAKKMVQQSVEKAQIISKSNSKSKPVLFETFKLDASKKLLDSDPVLALASLRIEIERKLSLAVRFFALPSKRESLGEFVGLLREKEVLSQEQYNALRKIINLCNLAVHGYAVSRKEAEDILDLAEQLNKSFSVGYSIDFNKNGDYKKHGLDCPWEHCIEHMPLEGERTEKSCPIFGHDCPEGSQMTKKCIPKVE